MLLRGHRLLGLVLGCTLLIAGIAVGTAQDKPSATVTISSTSVALGVGVQWGDGILRLADGKQYPFTVQGLQVAGLGYADVRAEGRVYNLDKVTDFSGIYVAAEASAAVPSGAPGAVTMRNQHGVVINLSSTQDGLKLTLAGEGVRLALK